MEILTLLAILLSPVIAVQVQKILEQRREKHQRRVWVFKVLMSTRGLALSPDHVQSLNMIDVEFYGRRKFKKVIAAWRIYLDHLALVEPDNDSGWERWHERRNDLLTDLIFEMGNSLGFDFDKVQIKRTFYIPKGHSQIEQEQNALRRGLVELLNGTRVLPMEVRSFPELEPTPEQQAANNLLMDLVERERQRSLPETATSAD